MVRPPSHRYPAPHEVRPGRPLVGPAPWGTAQPHPDEIHPERPSAWTALQEPDAASLAAIEERLIAIGLAVGLCDDHASRIGHSMMPFLRIRSQAEAEGMIGILGVAAEYLASLYLQATSPPKASRSRRLRAAPAPPPVPDDDVPDDEGGA